MVLNLAGSLSLMETAAAMDRCSAVVTNDTGLMHLATARQRPVVAVFGPTVREFGFYPLGNTSLVLEVGALDCRPCTHIGRSYCPKEHFRCMLDIPAQRAVDGVAQLLAH
jgi:heptosyltransferase-2